MDIVLSNKIVVLSKKNSKSDLWDIVDSFPCLLELSVEVNGSYNGTTYVLVKNTHNGKSCVKTVGQLGNILFYCEIQ